MGKIVVGIVMVAVGCLLFINRQRFVDKIVRINNSGFGLYKFDKGMKNYGLWFTTVFSIICVALGLLTVFGIFKLK